MTTKLLTIPDGYTEAEDSVMSNFDGVIDRTVEAVLKSEPKFAAYTAWNFYGTVWWTGTDWACEIRRHRSHINTLRADSLEEIMAEACGLYGRD